MRLPEVPKGVAFDGRVQLCRQIVIAVGICAEKQGVDTDHSHSARQRHFLPTAFWKKRQLRNAALQPSFRKEKHGRSQQQCQCDPVKQKGRQETLRLLLIGLMQELQRESIPMAMEFHDEENGGEDVEANGKMTSGVNDAPPFPSNHSCHCAERPGTYGIEKNVERQRYDGFPPMFRHKLQHFYHHHHDDVGRECYYAEFELRTLFHRRVK